MTKTKYIFILIFLCLCTCFQSENVYAYENSSDNLSSYIDTDSLYSYISDDILDFFENEEININNINSLKNLDIGSLVEFILESIKNKINVPIRAFCISFVLIIISSSVTSFSSGIIDKNNTKIFETICAMVSIIYITNILYDCFINVCEMIQFTSEFVTAFIPIFSSVLLLSTGEATASGYNIALFYICSAIINITNNFFIPIFSMLFCISIADSINTVISFKGIIDCFTKIITSGSKFILSVFISVLSFQTIFNNTTDRIGHKAIKTIISSSIPIVGSAISEAYVTLQSSISIFKNYIGLFGIIIICLILFPILAELLLNKLMIVILKNLAGTFNAEILEKIFSHYENLISIALALLICVIVMFSITLAISIVFSQSIT